MTGRNILHLILRGELYTDNKTIQRYHNKRKIQTNFP